MLKLGAGYYAVMDCATSLGQLVAPNDRSPNPADSQRYPG